MVTATSVGVPDTAIQVDGKNAQLFSCLHECLKTDGAF